MSADIRKGESVHSVSFEEQLREYCAIINPFLPQILRKWGGSCGYRDATGALEKLELRSQANSLETNEYDDQFEADGNYSIGLFHSSATNLRGIGAFMSFLYPFGNPNPYIFDKHQEYIFSRYPQISINALCVTQLQGPLATFTDTHRSLLINPKYTNPHRIPWERVFLDIAIDLARTIGMDRIYLLPAEYNNYYQTAEKLLRMYGDKAISSGLLDRQNILNARLHKRYNGTPQSLGWKRLEPDGPWYRETGIDG